MKSTNKMFFLLFILTFLFSCNNDSSDKQISIDKFSEFPSEVDGCTCYFSYDSIDFNDGIFIYVNDFAQTSFLKINGTITKFMQTDYKEIGKTKVIAKAKADNYEMTIELNSNGNNNNNSSLKTGTIKIKDNQGNQSTQTFYGECGC